MTFRLWPSSLIVTPFGSVTGIFPIRDSLLTILKDVGLLCTDGVDAVSGLQSPANWEVCRVYWLQPAVKEAAMVDPGTSEGDARDLS